MNSKRLKLSLFSIILILFNNCVPAEEPISNPQQGNNNGSPTETKIAVASISLSSNTLSLTEGETTKIQVSISPSNATNKTVSFSSSNTSIATVNSDGTVTAKGAGTATITCTTSDGTKKATCSVTVKAATVSVIGVTLDKTDLSLNVGEEYYLTATIDPSNASEHTIEWSSASSSIATVKNGLVKGIAVGETTITARIGGKSTVCNVKVGQIDYSKEYFTIELLSDGDVSYQEKYPYNCKIETSTDNGQTWNVGLGGRFKKGDKIRIRGKNLTYYNRGYFITNGTVTKLKVYGNLMSLIDYDFEDLDTFPAGCTQVFQNFFYNCKGLISAKNLVFPNNTTEACYKEMFFDCGLLTEGPTILPAKKLAKDCYNGMFRNCASLQNAPELPATSLAESCYMNMFLGCEKLTTAPELPATQLETRCYAGMFNRTGLIKSPDLPAETIPCDAYHSMFFSCKNLVTTGTIRAKKTISASSSYIVSYFDGYGTYLTGNMSRMFAQCSSLVVAPRLVLTTIGTGCLSEMFSECTKLKEAPELPATTLASRCYSEMFNGCTSLSKPPKLPATVLADDCYEAMFMGCTSLVETPALPAETLNGASCYARMFEGCTSLKTAEYLPATSLTEKCYYRMFAECASLVNAPSILPAMSLAEMCYEEMFYNCRSLKTAPILPATSLVRRSYYQMFFSCIRLNYIKALFLDLPKEDDLSSYVTTYWRTFNWLLGVAGEGTFVKNVSSKWDVSGVSGVPDGWAVEYASE